MTDRFTRCLAGVALFAAIGSLFLNLLFLNVFTKMSQDIQTMKLQSINRGEAPRPIRVQISGILEPLDANDGKVNP